MLVVVEEGGEVCTVNLFVSAVLQRAHGAARQAEFELVGMESSRGQESTSWENAENDGNCAIYRRTVGVFHSHRGQRQRRFWKVWRGEGQEGKQDQRQQESLFREILEQVRGNADTGCGTPNDAERLFISQQGMAAGKSSKKECTEEESYREAHEKVAISMKSDV